MFFLCLFLVIVVGWTGGLVHEGHDKNELVNAFRVLNPDIVNNHNQNLCCYQLEILAIVVFSANLLFCCMTGVIQSGHQGRTILHLS